MGVWHETIDIKKVLNNDDLEVNECARQISELLLSSIHQDVTLAILCRELCECEEVEQFDSVLEQIYDWADSRKVWLGI